MSTTLDDLNKKYGKEKVTEIGAEVLVEIVEKTARQMDLSTGTGAKGFCVWAKRNGLLTICPESFQLDQMHGEVLRRIATQVLESVREHSAAEIHSGNQCARGIHR